MEPIVIFWICAVVAFLIVEAATTALVSLWFVGGSVAALIVALLHGQLWLQITVFVVVSGLLLLTLRPLARRFAKPRIKTNVDSIVGEIAVVTERIDNLRGSGAVKLDGKEWSARSESGTSVEKDAVVRVVRVEGVKVYVKEEKA